MMKKRKEENNVVSQKDRKSKFDNSIKPLSFFANNLWNELKRFDLNGKQIIYKKNGEKIDTVTITEDNMMNLYNSQFERKLGNKDLYSGKVFRYSLF